MSQLSPIEDAAFDGIAELLRRSCGLTFAAARRDSFRNRLGEAVRALGLESLADLQARLRAENHGSRVWNTVIDLAVTDETSWFRYNDQYDALRDFVLPAVTSKKGFDGEDEIRILSAGCSRGQEPYSIAMVLRELPEFDRAFHATILAVDLCQFGLDYAARGVYHEVEMRGLPGALRERYFVREGSSNYRLADEVREMVVFRQHNLLNPLKYGAFDIVFCRNVTIYFERETTRRVISNLVQSLRPGGHLFVGHAESYSGLLDELKQVQMARTFIYRRSHGAMASMNQPGRLPA